MQEFGLMEVEEYLVFEVGGQVFLVDTGSPVSLSLQAAFEFLGKEYRKADSIAGYDIENISRLLGKDIDVLLGMDILSEYVAEVDYNNRKIAFGNAPSGTDYPINMRLNKILSSYLTLPLTVSGEELPIIFDTGASIAYLDSSLTGGKIPSGKKEDFHTLVDRFVTPLYDMRVGDPLDIEVQFGNLPKRMEMVLGMVGIKGIIGFDILKNFKTCIDLPSSTLRLTRY